MNDVDYTILGEYGSTMRTTQLGEKVQRGDTRLGKMRRSADADAKSGR